MCKERRRRQGAHLDARDGLLRDVDDAPTLHRMARGKGQGMRVRMQIPGGTGVGGGEAR
jgi:hypothetical protein